MKKRQQQSGAALGLSGTAVPLASKSASAGVGLVSKKPLTARPTPAKAAPLTKAASSGAKKAAAPPKPQQPQPPSVRDEALALLALPANPATSGMVVIRWNHYRKPFVVHNGVVKFSAIDEEYCFSFVYKGNFSRRLRLDVGNGDDEEESFLPVDDAMEFFCKVDPKLAYRIVVEEDPVAGVGAEGLRLRDGPLIAAAAAATDAAPKQSRAVQLITQDLLAMNVNDLNSAEAKALRESRDVEDVLFAGAL